MSSDFLSESERYLIAHITDLAQLSERSGVPRFSAFLNERESAAAKTVAGAEFFGGYEGAQRTLCGFFADTYAQDLPHEDFYPISAATFTFRERDKLSHRDFLGAILSLGLKREVVGDILTDEGCAIVFCSPQALGSILSITKVGNIGVSAQEGVTKPLPEVKTKLIEAFVSSLRLDCVVSAAANLSRDKAVGLIKAGLVNLDFAPCTNVSKEVRENIVFSVRGSGRFRLKQIGGCTRNGRIHIVIEKFI